MEVIENTDVQPVPSIQVNDEVRKIIYDAAYRQVERQLPLFGSIRDVDKDELVSYLVTHALDKALAKYDPSKGAKLSTYLNGCFYRRLIDLWRSKTTIQNHEQKAGLEKIRKDLCNYSGDICNYFNVDSDCGLAELGQRCLSAVEKSGMPRYWSHGRRYFTQHQLLATVLVMRAMQANVTGVLYIIKSSAGLRESLLYTDRIPTHQRMYQFIQRFEAATGYRFKRVRKNLTLSK